MNDLEPADTVVATPRRRVVIIGAGFGGLACAGALGDTDVDVIVIDRRNHNLFQPLLYQVATAALSPADIAEPIRRTLGRYRNVHIMLAEANGIDVETKQVTLKDGGTVFYDQLVIATGSDYNYFGHDAWQHFAPGLKTLHEARRIRHRLLLSFEKAERTKDPAERKALLTSIVVGGGPTGVEMAGAISELGRSMAHRDFRSIPASDLRVILVEAGPRILSAFPEHLQAYAIRHLETMGVEVRLGAQVSDITAEGAVIAGHMVPAGSVVWGAGVKASPAFRWLGIEGKASGRIPVDARLRVEGFKDIFSLGDTSFQPDKNGAPLPALAQVAKQQGRYLGKLLARPGAIETAKPFHFANRGNTAVIGRNAAIFDFGRWTLKGYFAWILWAIVHVYLLVNFEKRMLVTVQWIWRYLTRQRGARLIDENDKEDVAPAIIR
ncbi:NADH dehydrogenase FAD-containing subunit [Rhizobium sp. PP-CC-3A-592]|nr:NADH dehydrogenase FAD-containing subunit [Rhizobium sp. PP-CC-3A-592]